MKSHLLLSAGKCLQQRRNHRSARAWKPSFALLSLRATWWVMMDKHVCCGNTARSARDEGIVFPLVLQGGAGGVKGTPRIPGQVKPLPVRARTLGQEQAVLLGYLRGFPPPRGPAGAPRSVQRLVLHQSSAVPTPVATRCWGRGGSQAGTVTSSFPLRGECAASNHPIQPKHDNWGLNGGKFKPQLRKGLVLVKTHGLLA